MVGIYKLPVRLRTGKNWAEQSKQKNTKQAFFKLSLRKWTIYKCGRKPEDAFQFSYARESGWQSTLGEIHGRWSWLIFYCCRSGIWLSPPPAKLEVKIKFGMSAKVLVARQCFFAAWKTAYFLVFCLHQRKINDSLATEQAICLAEKPKENNQNQTPGHPRQ